MHRFFIILFAILTPSILVLGQELNCNVTVNADRVQTSDRRVFQDMETALEQFLNNKKWTNDAIENEERINANLAITIETMPSIGNFVATVQIQSARPIHETNYESLLFNFADREWEFEYIESQPLDFSENTFTNNLSSMLSFYAYIMIGLDYDSFSELGGSPYFEKASNIVNNAQNSGRDGWQQFDSNRNRYWLSENLNSQQMLPIREGFYKYHRMALDNFAQNPDESRKIILAVLKELEKINKNKPNSILVIAFFDAKTDELANIFSKGNMQTRREAYNVLSEIDPSNSDKYRSIIQN